MKKGEFAIIVLDVGSSSMKGFLYNQRGECLEKGQYYYKMTINGEAATQKAYDFDKGVQSNCQKLVGRSNILNIDIKGIVYTSQRSSLVCISKNGDVLMDFIMWYDKRSQGICDGINNRLNSKHIQICGVKSSPILLAPKIAWVKKNMPQINNEVFKYISIQDYLIYRATRELATDPTLACRTGIMDIRNKNWSSTMMKHYQIREDQLCRIVPTGSIVGYVTEEFYDSTGVPKGIPVITAGGDQQSSVIGQGLEAKTIGLTLGSGAYAVGVTDSLAGEMSEEFNISASSYASYWNIEKSIPSAGTSYDWCRNTFYGTKCTPEEFNEKLSLSPVGANGVRSSTKYYVKAVGKRSIENLGLGNTKEDIARAVIEGVIMDIASACKSLCSKIGDIDNIYVTGGMSKSDLLNQMLSDMMGMPVVKNYIDEATALGAWIIGMTALGVDESVMKIRNDLKENEKTYRPNKDAVKIYETINKALLKRIKGDENE